MVAPKLPTNDSSATSRTSRRAVLRALTATPIAVSVVVSPWGEALATLHREHNDEPALPCRSGEGRSLSRFRYHRAESFFESLEAGLLAQKGEALYYSGIVAQLALSSHLLDIGFDDEWCARHIGLRVAKSLAYANATGLGHECLETARLAAVLTPYWKWSSPLGGGETELDDGGFTADRIRPLLRALLDRVHRVTGHPRPRGWGR